jgi:hypothetical protein
MWHPILTVIVLLATTACTAPASVSAPRFQQLPADCYLDTPHADTAPGMGYREALLRERLQLAKSNTSKSLCATFHDDMSGEARR